MNEELFKELIDEIKELNEKINILISDRSFGGYVNLKIWKLYSEIFMLICDNINSCVKSTILGQNFFESSAHFVIIPFLKAYKMMIF